MTMRRVVGLFVVVFTLAQGDRAWADDTIPYDKLSTRIVTALQVEPGERVLLR